MTLVQLEPELLDGIEKFIADRDEPPRGKMTYNDAINVIVRDWLMGQGYVSLPDDPNPVTPALEAANVPGKNVGG